MAEVLPRHPLLEEVDGRRHERERGEPGHEAHPFAPVALDQPLDPEAREQRAAERDDDQGPHERHRREAGDLANEIRPQRRVDHGGERGDAEHGEEDLDPRRSPCDESGQGEQEREHADVRRPWLLQFASGPGSSTLSGRPHSSGKKKP